MTKSSGLKLNKEQIEAIKYKKGPLLIIAGAGTGKTTVISERIKYLILGKFAKPDEILALTFTEKAAKEMEERVDISMPYGYTQMWISTFHSFCDRILRAEALHIGLDPKYKLMTQSETVQFIRNNIFKFSLDYFRPLGNPTKFVTGMLQHFSRLQDEDVTPAEYLSWVKKQISKLKLQRNSEEAKLEIKKWNELANAFKVYEELKVKESVMDFGDLIVKTLELFRRRSNILKVYRKQFKYVLVDEFQDTNYAQYELIKLLADPQKDANITVVGDDSQSIYKFRGAAVSNILSFKKDYPKAKMITLVSNYRSTQTILDSAYRLIKFNDPDTLEAQLGVSKKLIAQKKNKEEEIKFIHTDRVENEADEVAKEILQLTAQDQYEYRDFAVLVRANNHAEPFMRALSRKGIPYQFLGPGRLFKQPEIVDLISYLKVLYNFEDSVAFYKILSMNYFDIPPRDLASIGNFARRYNISLFEACEKANEIFLNKETKEKINKLLEQIKKHLGLVRKESAGQLLYYFLESTGLLVKMLSPESPEAEKKAMNISRFFDKLKTYEVDHEDATVPAVVDWLELSSELGESPLAANIDWNDVNAVNILTAHSAKGLEFPVVFLVNLVSQRFPTTEKREQIPIPEKLIKEVLPVGDYHIEEERRLFYVGMTRAKELLYLTAADYYGEGKRGKRLSPFIFESLGDKAVTSEQSVAKVDQLSFLDYESKMKPAEALAKVGEALHIDYLSYSQIETFEICPLHYKLRYIYKVPTPPSASQSFGTSMHATLKDFYEIAQNDRSHFAKASRDHLENLILQILEKGWIKEGYKDKKHEKDFFEKGKLYLSGFLKDEFNPKNLPVTFEQPFVLPLRSLARRGVVPSASLKIGGKIDRVDQLADGSIEIIDYKTGATIPSQSEVDKNLQLSFYALAASSIPQPPFGIKPEKIRLSLYFLDNQEKISTTRTKEQLKEAVAEIFKVRGEIEKSDFKCSGHLFCQSKCEYSLFCKSED